MWTWSMEYPDGYLQHLLKHNVLFISEISIMTWITCAIFWEFLTYRQTHFFIRITTISEASYLYLFACLRKPTCARLYNFFVVVKFHLIGIAQLFRLSKQFQILVLGSILLVILPSCVIHKSESVSSSKKLTKYWWSLAKHRDLWCIPETSHLN